MSNQKTEKKRVTFSYTGPATRSVLVAGDFTGWQEAPLSLKQDKKGVWKKVVSLPPGNYEYRLLVDGEWRDDPKCTQRRANQFGGENCVCIVNGV